MEDKPLDSDKLQGWCALSFFSDRTFPPPCAHCRVIQQLPVLSCWVAPTHNAAHGIDLRALARIQSASENTPGSDAKNLSVYHEYVCHVGNNLLLT